jgi:hypothetical protein
MRIDGSGNILFGATDTVSTSFGAKVLKDGSSSEIFAVHRQATDGDLIQFARGGNDIGSIGADSGDLVIDGASSHPGIRFVNSYIQPRYNGAASNGGVDIGSSASRFKDLYLSGGLRGDTLTFSNLAGTERMRIDSSGNLLVGTTGIPNGTSLYGAAFEASSGDRMELNFGASSASNLYAIRFFNPNGEVGSIRTSGSTTTYNTSSDQRLKDNIVDAPSSSDDIDAIQVRSFDWKADGSHQKYGMIAQELMTVAPEAVSGDPDSDEMMGVDYSKLVPMLIKEIQSLRARVAQLEGAN